MTVQLLAKENKAPGNVTFNFNSMISKLTYKGETAEGL